VEESIFFSRSDILLLAFMLGDWQGRPVDLRIFVKGALTPSMGASGQLSLWVKAV